MARELKAHRLQKQINELQVELDNHQSKCKHIKATGEYGSNTGNWDGRDSFWITARCPTCLYNWRISDDNEYREFGRTHEVI